MKISLILPLAALLLAAGCSRETGRITFSGFDTVSEPVTLTAEHPLQLWVDLEVRYSGDFSLVYDVSFRTNGIMVYSTLCDARQVSVRLRSVQIHTQGSHYLKYQGRLRFDPAYIPPGTYTLAVTPVAAGENFTLTKYDLILRQCSLLLPFQATRE